MKLDGMMLTELSLRCSIIWAGQEYPCSALPERDGQRLDEGGVRQVRSVQIEVRVTVFPDGIGIPMKGQTILYKKNAGATPRKYRIIEVIDYYGSALSLLCEDPNKSA
jgi:hypothetical protein